MSEIAEFWTQTIEQITGKQIMVDTSDCVIWKFDHTNCIGCAHELTCSKLPAIMEIQFQVMNYKPKDFLDQLKTNKQISDMIEKILHAETVEQVHSVLGEML